MRKKIVIKKRNIKPDIKYNSELVRKLTNKLMLDGKLIKAKNIVYKAANLIEKETNTPFDQILTSAIENIKPGIELKTKKIGGSRQRSAVKITPLRNTILALQILKNSVRENKSIKPFYQILAEEIKNCWKKNSFSNALKKKENILKEAESNRVSAY